MPNPTLSNQYDPSQLKPYLDSLSTSNDVRKNLWNGVTNEDLGPGEFKNLLDSSGLDQQVKHDLWDYKAEKAGLIPLTPHSDPGRGGIASSPPRIPTIGPSSSSWISSLIAPIREGAVGHALEATFPGLPNALRPQETVYNNPEHASQFVAVGSAFNQPGVIKGAGEFVGSLTTPGNVLQLLASGGLSTFFKSAVGRLVTLGFSAQMLHGAYKAIPDIEKAYSEGRTDDAHQLITESGLGAMMGAYGAVHGIRGSAPARIAEANGTPDVPTSPTPESVSQPSGKVTPPSINPEQQLNSSLALSPQSDAQIKSVPLQPAAGDTQMSQSNGNNVALTDAVRERISQQAAQVAARKTEQAAPTPVQKLESIPTPKPAPIAAPDVAGYMGKLSRLQTDINNAQSPMDANWRSKQLADTHGKLTTELENFTAGASTDELNAFRENLSTQASNYRTQAQAIRDAVAQDQETKGLREGLNDLKSQGGPAKKLVNPETGEVEAVKQDDLAGRWGRALISDLTGRQSRLGMGVDDIVPHDKPAGISDADWENAQNFWWNLREDLKKQITQSFQIFRDTQDPSKMDEIKYLLDDFNKTSNEYGKPKIEEAPIGNRANALPQVGPSGEVKPATPFAGIDLKFARTVFGRNLSKIPSHENFLDLAADKEFIADGMDKARARVEQVLTPSGERGSIGESDRPKVKLPNATEILGRAKSLGLNAHVYDENHTNGPISWIFPKQGVVVAADTLVHHDLASRLFPESEAKGSAMRDALLDGAVRKARSDAYQVHSLTDSAIKTIENDQMFNHRTGKSLVIDAQTPSGLRSIVIPSGWEDLGPEIEKRVGQLGQSGKVSGVAMTTGMTLGAISGGHIAGWPGAVVGGVLGGITPAMIDHPYVRNTFAKISPALRSYGIKPQDWLFGPEQFKINDPKMEDILTKQREGVRGGATKLISRIAQLPKRIQFNLSDKLVYLKDLDRDIWKSADLAQSGIKGTQDVHMTALRGVLEDVQKAGNYNLFSKFLNLNLYKRVYDTLEERSNGFLKDRADAMQQLQAPNLSARDRVQFEDRAAQAKSSYLDLQKRIAKGEVVPASYTKTEVNQALSDMRLSTDPQRLQQVVNSAQKVYNMTRGVLDELHNEGIVSDSNYKKFIARGNSYIPIHRIMDDLAEQHANWGGRDKNSLYLNKQNVVKGLVGSERTNVDPLVAVADWMKESAAEIGRNRVVRDYLDIAKKNPAVASTITEVPKGSKAAADSKIIGAYVNGEAKSYAVPALIGESLESVPPAIAKTAMGTLLRWGQKPFRLGATTANLGFNITRVIMNGVTALSLSEQGVELSPRSIQDLGTLGKMWALNVKDALVKGPKWAEAAKAGAAMSSLQSFLVPESVLTGDQLGLTKKIAGSRILDSVKALNRALDDAGHMTIFQRMRQSGASVKDSAWEARQFGGAPPYDRAGAYSHEMSLMLTFAHANLRHLTQVFSGVKEHPGRIGVAMAAMTGLGLALNQYAWSVKDQNGNPVMRKIAASERERNWIIPYGGERESGSGAMRPMYVRVPKPAFIRALYNPVEAVINKAVNHELTSGTQMGLDAISAISPIETNLRQGQLASSIGQGVVATMNPVLRVPLEQAGNFQTTQSGVSPIESQRFQGIDPQYRYTPTTNPAAVALGRETGLSPLRIQHALQGSTAGLWDYGSGLAAPFIHNPGQQSPMGFEQAYNRPVIGPIERRFSATAVDAEMTQAEQQFYNRATETSQHYRTFTELMKQDPSQAMEYFKANRDSIWQGKLASDLQLKVGKLNTTERQIQSTPGLDAATKAATLRSLYTTKQTLLDSFNKMIAPTKN